MILVTGGTGYIGTHTVLRLLESGEHVLILDNLSNSSTAPLPRIEALTGKTATFIQGDIRDRALLDKLFRNHPITAVIHFAGLKAVGESSEKPLEYFANNIGGTLTLLEAMRDHRIKTLIFSSSATVYGDPGTPAYTENMPHGTPSSPYGRSKLIIENILQDTQRADPEWNIALLRYFNPVGAHESGELGEDPQGIPNNLVPYIAQVAVGRLQQLTVFGNDYNTPDGTCQRDYIHVMDLADGHVKALQHIRGKNGIHIWNLGSGQPASVLDIIRAFETASGKTIPYRIAPRRPGDLARYWAVADKAARELHWQSTRNLEDMMRDTWRWQSRNPQGYPPA